MLDSWFVGVAIKPGVAGRIRWSGGATSRPIGAEVNVPTAAVAVALPMPQGATEALTPLLAGVRMGVGAAHLSLLKHQQQGINLQVARVQERGTSAMIRIRDERPGNPLLKSVATEDGMGFFQIQAANLNDIVASDLNSAAAQITVESGEVSSRLLVTELSRLVHVRWKWEVQELDSQVFVVPFPSKEELDRLVAVGTVTTKNKEGTLLFEEFVDDVQPIKVLDKVWVTVTKVPRLLRSFLPLWAVGTIIGETQKVDIYHLRQTGEVRILVAAFDVKKIPKYVDVCVKGSMYRLYFKPDEVAPEIFNPEDDDLLGDDDKDLDGDGDREMEEADDAPKPQDFEKGKSTSASDGTLPSHSQSGAYHKQAALIQEAMDLAYEQLFEEISIKVMIEKEGGEEWK
ncbi:uncharacterized protein LOC120654283 [Panicum virgatum]|uniref:uncharacterized protein LOC120654283 n=1 Tax=Panicum virgatum TaxID=38727 RepID=UPI0019D5DE68|nr:uncharacterized protein LOC120654283 [Panicum virgatum]